MPNNIHMIIFFVRIILILITVPTILVGCMFQVGISDLEQTIGGGDVPNTPPDLGNDDGGTGGDGSLTEVTGVGFYFHSLFTIYEPTREVFVVGPDAMEGWHWVKSVMGYLSFSKAHTTEDGYRVVSSSPDTLTEGGLFP